MEEENTITKVHEVGKRRDERNETLVLSGRKERCLLLCLMMFGGLIRGIRRCYR